MQLSYLDDTMKLGD